MVINVLLSSIVVLTVVLVKSFKTENSFDTVTDLRKRRKQFNDRHYKGEFYRNKKGGI